MKPSRETRGGFRVAFVPPAELEQTLKPKLKPNSDWIVQEAFQQHHLMAALNASSVNTLRIMTIRLGGEVAVVSAFIRIGVKGARVDNISSGSIAAGVTRDEATGTGRLGAFACDDKLKLHTTHPDHGYRFDGISLPFFKAAEALCKDLHAVIPDLGLLSWDIAIDAQGKPSVIEFNISRQEITRSSLQRASLRALHRSGARAPPMADAACLGPPRPHLRYPPRESVNRPEFQRQHIHRHSPHQQVVAVKHLRRC